MPPPTASLSAQAPSPAAPLPGDGPEDARLKQLFQDSDERGLKLDPMGAIYRGDLRYADRFGDYLSDARDEQQRRDLEGDLAALAAIDRAKLTPIDRVAYDVFRNEQQTALRGFAPANLKIRRAMPIDHMNGIQTNYPDFASGKGAAPFKTVADYRNNLTRNAGYAALYDRVITRFRDGMRRASSCRS